MSDLDSLTSAVQSLQQVTATLVTHLEHLAAKVDRLIIDWERREGAEAALAHERDAIRALPARVTELERALVEPRRSAALQLVESEHGRTVIRWLCGTAVLCSLAIGGGIAYSDIVGWLSGSTTVTVAPGAPGGAP